MAGADVKTETGELRLIHYPDPRLRQRCEEIAEFNGEIAALVERMFAIMQESKGVGLAASQVGVLKRLFVMNLTGEERDRVVFINPVLRDRDGSVESEEGCLSLPGINVNIRRARHCRIEAQDLEGRRFEVEGDDLMSHYWQHELDHLDGVLITDRMGPSDRIATRRTLKLLEEGYNGGHG